MIKNITIENLVQSGMHYGHLKSCTHPSMRKYIYGDKNGICIIDLDKTYVALKEACEFLKKIASKNGRILFVSTKKRNISPIMKQAAESCGQYYITNRWLGGILTNRKTVMSSIKKYKELQLILSEPERDSKYTKKEQLLMSRKLAKLERSFGGITQMGGVPDAIFVADVNLDVTAIREAKALNIPVVGIIDTNSDANLVDYGIPANDDGRKSVALCVHILLNSILEGLSIGAANNKNESKQTYQRSRRQNTGRPYQKGERSERSERPARFNRERSTGSNDRFSKDRSGTRKFDKPFDRSANRASENRASERPADKTIEKTDKGN